MEVFLGFLMVLLGVGLGLFAGLLIETFLHVRAHDRGSARFKDWCPECNPGGSPKSQ